MLLQHRCIGYIDLHGVARHPILLLLLHSTEPLSFSTRGRRPSPDARPVQTGFFAAGDEQGARASRDAEGKQFTPTVT
jgi:hypothetical protein